VEQGWCVTSSVATKRRGPRSRSPSAACGAHLENCTWLVGGGSRMERRVRSVTSPRACLHVVAGWSGGKPAGEIVILQARSGGTHRHFEGQAIGRCPRSSWDWGMCGLLPALRAGCGPGQASCSETGGALSSTAKRAFNKARSAGLEGERPRRWTQ